MSERRFSAKSPLGHWIHCDKRSWNHIIKGHPQMEENEEAIKKAISEPDQIYESAEWPKRDVYFGKSAEATYGERFYTKVVVDTPDEYNEFGSVVSAWNQKSISGNINTGGLKYDKTKPGSEK